MGETIQPVLSSASCLQTKVSSPPTPPCLLARPRCPLFQDGISSNKQIMFQSSSSQTAALYHRADAAAGPQSGDGLRVLDPVWGVCRGANCSLLLGGSLLSTRSGPRQLHTGRNIIMRRAATALTIKAQTGTCYFNFKGFLSDQRRFSVRSGDPD